MKVYLTYKFKDEDPNGLKVKLDEFSRLIEETTGWTTFVFFRDVQKWKKDARSIKEIFNDALSHIEKCDAILAEASEKARGVYLEVGYAKALGKKIIIVHKNGAEANLLEAMADIKIVYDTYEDLKEKLGRIKL